MTNGPERMALIRRMRAMLQHDQPWMSSFFSVSFALDHVWMRNRKPNQMANNSLKYLRVDLDQRNALRRKWNRPVWWPLELAGGILVLLLVPAWWVARRRIRKGAR